MFRDTIQISFWFLLPNKRLEKLVAERTANLEKRTFQLARLASQLTLAEQRLIPGRIQITGRFLQLQPFPISGLPREQFYSVISSGPVSL